MREILFKAKRIDNGQWVEGLPSYNENAEIGQIEVYHKAAFVFYDVDPSTICQCTGLKDKNGKLIWENDIVKDNFIFGSVSWDGINARFVIDDIYDGYQDYSDWWNEVQVIGNIFDNPELINE